MTEPEELLKLIDGHIGLSETDVGIYSYCMGYYAGMIEVRRLVYNFFNAPKKEETKNDQQDFGL
jgi:hypothetical protein